MDKLKEYLMQSGTLKESVPRLLDITKRYGLLVVASYLLASVCSAFVMSILSDSVAKNIRPLSPSGSRQSGMALLRRTSVNYHDIKKNIMERNIFNSEGKFPEEKELVRDGGENNSNSFNLDGPCKDTSLNISLVGTIFNGSRFNSFAVVREKGYSQSDVYGVGDEIIGEEQASIAAVDPQSMIINNDGVKECMTLEQPKGSVDPYAGSAPSITPPPKDGLAKKADGSVEVSLAEVEKASGEGGEGLLNSGRIVPITDPETNQPLGFKLISVKAGGLFAKLGLSNGDIITQVNDTSLKDPANGIQFYNVFEDETDIKISFLRNGKQPTTINVTIK